VSVVRTRNRNGVHFSRAPLPGKHHRCEPWTTTQVTIRGRLVVSDRCACGAIRTNGGPWSGVNSRRENG